MMQTKKPVVGILMGSDSDLTVMKSAAEILEEFGIPYEMTIISAHRTPERAARYAKDAAKRGLKIIIGGAGGAAHLCGVIAAFTTLPVIGVPILSKLNGLDSLLSTVQMPDGVPVATVAINNAKNAGILACEILALSSPAISKKMGEYKSKIKTGVEQKAAKLETEGYKKFLATHK